MAVAGVSAAGAESPEQRTALLHSDGQPNEGGGSASSGGRAGAAEGEAQSVRSLQRLPVGFRLSRSPIAVAGMVLVIAALAAFGAGSRTLRQAAREGLAAAEAVAMLNERGDGRRWASLGEGTACRGESVNSSAEQQAKPHSARSLEECQSRCAEDGNCTAVQYGPGVSCSFFVTPVTYFEELKGSICSVRVPEGSARTKENATCIVLDNGSHDQSMEVTLKIVSGVGEELCRTLCRSAFGESCTAVAYAEGPKRCEMWRQPIAFEERQGMSCSVFGSMGVGTASHADGTSSEPCTSALCNLDSWRSHLGWDSVFPWMATSTTTTSTVTTTSTTRTGTSTTTTTTGTETSTTNTNTKTTATSTETTSRTTDADCHTAVPGEECHTNVLWVFKEGFHDHPSWYKGLNESSTFEEVQEYLRRTHPDTSKCDKRPCVFAATYDEHSTLFCFSIVQEGGYEVAIMEEQLKRKAGIFACDGQALLSGGTSFSIAGVQTIEFKNAKVGISKDGTAGNTLLFLHAWHALKDHTNFAEYDWVVKVDPDAVLLASRLRRHLAPFVGARHYMRNCNLYPDNPDFPMMFGSLEVFSLSAIQAYFDGEDICRKDLEWHTWGEDYFMGHCLDYLGVTPVDDFSVISDGVCKGADCMDSHAAAFHPFKSADSWIVCWDLAQEQESRQESEPAPPRRISGAIPVFEDEEAQSGDVADEKSLFDALEAPSQLPSLVVIPKRQPAKQVIEA